MSKLDLKQRLIIIFFLSLPFIDLVTSLTTRFTNSTITIGIIVKGLSLLLSLIYVLFFSQCKYRKLSIFYIGILALFAILYFATKPDVLIWESFFTEITFAFKYFYFPTMLVCLYNIFTDFRIDNLIIKRIILVNSIALSVLILLPQITNTGFFTYGYAGSGISGWFYAANEIGATLAILSICVFDLMKSSNIHLLLLAIPIILATSLIGTKVSFLGLLVSILGAVTIYLFKHRKQGLVKGLLILAILISCCVCSPSMNNISGLANKLSAITPSTEQTSSNDEIADAKDASSSLSAIEIINQSYILKILNRLTSSRIYLLIENGTPFVNGNLSTKLFGLGFAPRTAIEYSFARRLAEIDIFDIILHYGIIGFGVYFAPLIFLAYKFFKNLKFISFDSAAYLLAAMLGIGISCIAGHVLGAPAVSIYIILMLLVVIQQISSKKT